MRHGPPHFTRLRDEPIRHAIKAFARLRDVLAGSSTKTGIDEYLSLLSVAETCEYREIDFLEFLLSRERDIVSFVRRRRRYQKQSTTNSAPRSKEHEVDLADGKLLKAESL